MVEVEIRGKKFPLCLTVAALDQINAKCGGMNGIGAFLDGGGTNEEGKTARIMRNTAWMLALLLQEGEESRLVVARLDGESTERRDIPSFDDLGHLLTCAGVNKYRQAVVQAVNESMKQDIEALYPKNVKSAEQG